MNDINKTVTVEGATVTLNDGHVIGPGDVTFALADIVLPTRLPPPPSSFSVELTWFNPRWKQILRTAVWRRRRGRAAHLRRPRGQLVLGKVA